ncbi:uracil-DNA glycosylase-like protein [Peziza echinospora]|nr:uracil-DNA glycosylase-like protein [Peziza echinospora]
MVGHCYSDPTNRFWKYLHHGGLTPDRILPSVEDQSLPAKYSLGTTNLLSRPTLNQSELSEQELLDGVKSLEEKIGRFKPEAVCIVGKKIWESIYCVKMGVKKFPKVRGWEYGWQEGMAIGKKEGEGGEGEGWQGARVFVVPSTSGLVTMPQREMKAQWEVLGDWVNRRREARGIKVPLAP